MEEKSINAEDEAMNKLVKEILKSGDVKNVFDVEDKLKKSFGKIIQSMLEAEMTEHQTCIVHLTRNTLKYVSHKDKYKFAQDLKAIYTASDEEIAKKLMNDVTNTWKEKYPTAMDRWEENWGIIS